MYIALTKKRMHKLIYEDLVFADETSNSNSKESIMVEFEQCEDAIKEYEQQIKDTFNPERKQACKNIQTQKTKFLNKLELKSIPLADHLRKWIQSKSKFWFYNPPSNKKIEWDL